MIKQKCNHFNIGDYDCPMCASLDFHEMANHNIMIGSYAGSSLVKGSYNIFLGDDAGKDETDCGNTFILKTDVGIIRKTITKEQWEAFNEIIIGAVLTEIDLSVPYDMK